MDLSGITKWAHGVMLGPAPQVDNKIREAFKVGWWRIGSTPVPSCEECGVLLAGKNGIKRHRNHHWQAMDLQEDIDYLYEYLGIEESSDGESEDPAPGATGSGDQVHDASERPAKAADRDR